MEESLPETSQVCEAIANHPRIPGDVQLHSLLSKNSGLSEDKAQYLYQ